VTVRCVPLLIALFSALSVSLPAAAAIKDTAHDAFTVEEDVEVGASPARAYDLFVSIGRWWDSGHTFSGDAHHLTIDATAGGCFCETLKDGNVEHMRVIFASRGEMLRLKGGLGPLQGTADGVMSVAFAPAPGGGTKISLTYRVWGYEPAGLENLANPVDGVLGEQLMRYRDFVAATPP
jgi:hypothetical protein